MAITISSPINEQEFSVGDEIIFKGTANNNIAQIELLADDRWSLGKSQINDGNWTASYTFNSGGTREIVVKGFDAANNLVADEDIWIFLESSSVLDLNMKLSANFTLREFVRSDTAIHFNIDNTPTPREIENLRTLCKQILQPARDELGPLYINSGFRSAVLNKAVNGSPTSAHRKGFAADVDPVEVGTRKFAEWVHDHCEFDQIILEFGTEQNPKWIHVSAEPRNRKQVLRISRSGTTIISL